VAVGGSHHSNLYTLIPQPGDTAGPFPFNDGSPFELQAYLGKKSYGMIESGYHNAYIVHLQYVTFCHCVSLYNISFS
jgi:hypothetical protein